MSHKTALKNRIRRGLPRVSERPMFGCDCFIAGGKFFVGFSRKDASRVILRLPKEVQKNAVARKGIRPFRHGAKAGWIEIDERSVRSGEVFKWIRKAHSYALSLSQQAKKKKKKK
ncbi:MAG: MmcQ/YjbR family DNA-binding protein [Nitrososphaerales archaeon]